MIPIWIVLPVTARIAGQIGDRVQWIVFRGMSRRRWMIRRGCGQNRHHRGMRIVSRDRKSNGARFPPAAWNPRLWMMMRP
jgi:hypothetical protein